MRLLKPDRMCRYLTEVTPDMVRSLGCKAVAIDADNTSSYDLMTDPLPGTEDWVRSMKEADIPVILLSNAQTRRARKLADRYDIPVIGLAAKPLRQGYLRAALKMRVRPSEIVMLGDQLFTDVLGANRSGCKSVWVLPYEEDNRDAYFLLKRKLEKPFLQRWKGTML